MKVHSPQTGRFSAPTVVSIIFYPQEILHLHSNPITSLQSRNPAQLHPINGASPFSILGTDTVRQSASFLSTLTAKKERSGITERSKSSNSTVPAEDRMNHGSLNTSDRFCAQLGHVVLEDGHGRLQKGGTHPGRKSRIESRLLDSAGQQKNDEDRCTGPVALRKLPHQIQ